MTARALSAALAAALVLALVPASAAADGLPAVGIDAKPLSIPGGGVAYVTERARPGTRVIERAVYGGPLRKRLIRGVYSVPAVAYDGSPGGLSADGRTLVLISPRKRYPRRRTSFVVLDTRRLDVRRRIALNGDFSFDAISPGGGVMYLIQYDPHNLANYAVRAYDMRAGRLLPDPVVDPDEADEPMTGVPVTRALGRDARWAYTLYDSPEHPFVHALDTEGRTAVCIDLDNLEQVWGATLELRGPNLEVRGRRGRLLATIDTKSHDLTRQIARPARRARSEPGEDGGSSWLVFVLPTAALLLAAVAGRRRILRRRRVAALPEV